MQSNFEYILFVVILRYSVETFVVLGLLALLLVESIARVVTLVRYYRPDEAAATTPTPATGS
jgi:hypothetical protein